MGIYGKSNWYSELKDIFIRMDFFFLLETFMTYNIDLEKCQLFDAEETECREEMSKKPKLNDAKVEKKCLQMHVGTPKRSLFSQIRFGILPIEIEVGRDRQNPGRIGHITTVSVKLRMRYISICVKDLKTVAAKPSTLRLL